MRKVHLAICIVLAVGGIGLVIGATRAGSGMGRAREVSVTGKLSCTFCTLAHPEKPCTPECCVNCVKAGDPPSLTDAQGNLFVLLTGEKETKLMTPARLEMMGGQVTVKGMLVNQRGLQAIYVDSMEKAEPRQVNIAGRLSCTFCTLAHPDTPCTPECCMNCVKAGDPPSLMDAQGNMYLLLNGEQGVPLMTPARLQMMGGQVNVQGLLVNRGGIQAIYVDSMQK